MNDWVDYSEVKSRVTIEQVLRSYRVDWLRRSGAQQYRGRCPIHQGQGQEAFHANFGQNVFHCFACGAGGNVLDLVAAMEGCSIREAALRLRVAQVSGGAVTSQPRQRQLVTKKRIINAPPLSFSLSLDRRHSYLARRGMDAATADRFGVGYYGGGGLMSGRIAIPIHDERGRLVAYCGRTIDGATPRYRQAFRSRACCSTIIELLPVGSNRLIVVEGFFDCMRVHQAGFPCVVALMGARLSRMQRALVTDRFSSVVLLLDGDPTGRRATAQIASDLAPALTVTTIMLPAGQQPDQMQADQIQDVLTRAERRLAIGDH
jgi:DNA primase